MATHKKNTNTRSNGLKHAMLLPAARNGTKLQSPNFFFVTVATVIKQNIFSLSHIYCLMTCVLFLICYRFIFCRCVGRHERIGSNMYWAVGTKKHWTKSSILISMLLLMHCRMAQWQRHRYQCGRSGVSFLGQFHQGSVSNSLSSLRRIFFWRSNLFSPATLYRTHLRVTKSLNFFHVIQWSSSISVV